MSENARIVPYSDDRFDDLRHCLDVLQDHIVSIDPLGRACRFPDRGTAYAEKTLEKIRRDSGKIFLALDVSGNCLGCVAGAILPPEDTPELGYVRREPMGDVAELVVLPEYRGQRIGEALMTAMEEYFRASGCVNVWLEVFGPNVHAKRFYERIGYSLRTSFLLKSL